MAITVKDFGSDTPFGVVHEAPDGFVPLFNQRSLSLAAFHRLWALGRQSSYGEPDGTRLTDPQFRASREISNVLLDSNFVTCVIMEIRRAGGPLHERLQFRKLLLYTEEGGFELHFDHISHPRMTQTVVVNVPVEGGNEYELTRGPKVERRQDDTVNIFGFGCNIEHAVRMIRGKRVCLVFDGISMSPATTRTPVARASPFDASAKFD